MSSVMIAVVRPAVMIAGAEDVARPAWVRLERPRILE